MGHDVGLMACSRSGGGHRLLILVPEMSQETHGQG